MDQVPVPHPLPPRWRRLSTRAAAIGIVLAAMVILSCSLLAVAVVRVTNANRWVQHTDYVVAQANASERQVIEAQSSMRGYVLTGDPAFLRPLRIASAVLPADLAQLERLVADNPAQERRAHRLSRAVNAYVRVRVPATLALDRPHAIAWIARSRGTHVNRIRAQFTRFRAEETRLLRTRSNRAEAARGWALGLAIGTPILCLLLLGGAATFVRRRVTTPIHRLAAAAVRRSQGERGVRVPVRGHDELAVLSERFNGMTATRERIEGELAYSVALLEQSFEFSPIGQARIGLDGRWQRVNHTLEVMLGYTEAELVNQHANQSLHPDDVRIGEAERRCLLTGEIQGFQVERRHLNRVGTAVPTLVSVTLLRDGTGEPVCFLTQLVDLTDAERVTEERLARDRSIHETQRLESLGVLAGGIAHDFNNLLMGVIGNADLLQHNPSLDASMRKRVDQIAASGQRGAQLTQQMLAYSGKSRLVIEPISLSAVVEGLDELIRVALPRGTTILLDLTPDLPLVEGDLSELRQVVLTLVTNAAEALDTKGAVTVSSGVMELDAGALDEFELGDKLKPGSYVWIEVADTGHGMDEQTRTHIFDPFFTTKFAGRGLGLATVLGIVRSHNGALRVSSEVDHGSTFTVILPVAAAPAGQLLTV